MALLPLTEMDTKKDGLAWPIRLYTCSSGLFYPHKIKPQGNAALAIVGHATTKLVL